MPTHDLVAAAEQGETDQVRVLLDSFAKFSADELADALSSAATAGHAQIVGMLLSHGVPIDQEAFLSACESEQPAVFEEFIKHGWDVNSTEFGDPALRLVVNSYDCTKFLLERGADPNLRGECGFAPLETAALEPSVEVLDLLLSYGAELDPQALYSAISRRGRGGIPAMKFLIEKGIDVNAFDKHWTSPLHWAVLTGDKERVQLLLDNGADKTNNKFAGRTPADLAKERGKAEIYKMLSK